MDTQHHSRSRGYSGNYRGFGRHILSTRGSAGSLEQGKFYIDWESAAHHLQFSPSNFPVWAYGLSGHVSPEYGGFYGFPRTPEGKIKIGC